MKSKAMALGKGYDHLVGQISRVLETGRNQAAWSLNSIMSAVYWEIGRRIVEFEQAGRERADYGERVIEQLSIDLRERFGNGFGRSNLFQIRAFYLAYARKVQTPSGQFTPRAGRKAIFRNCPDSVWTIFNAIFERDRESVSAVVVSIRPPAFGKEPGGSRFLRDRSAPRRLVGPATGPPDCDEIL